MLESVLFQSDFELYKHVFNAKLTGYSLMIIVSSIFVYRIYVNKISEREIPPPISAWGLWLLLDIVAMYAELKAGKFNIQLIVYTIGTTYVCLHLVRQPKFLWDKVWDNLTAISVLLAIALWIYTNDPNWGLILSLSGMTLAAIPMIISITKGAEESLGVWLLILAGSVISYFYGNKVSGIWLGTLQLFTILLILKYKKQREVYSH